MAITKPIFTTEARRHRESQSLVFGFSRCLGVSVADKKKARTFAFRALSVYQEEETAYLPMVKSTLVLPATLTTWEVVLPLCHTNALYWPSGTFWMK